MNVISLFAASYVFLLAFAAVSDYRKLLIPNWISIALIGLFFIFAAFVRPELPMMSHVGVAVAVLAVGLVLFALRWMSGGDVKLLAAVALWAGPDQVLSVIFVVTLLGALLAVAVLQVKWLYQSQMATAIPPMLLKPIPGWAKLGLCPYALAISAGGLFLLPHLFL